MLRPNDKELRVPGEKGELAPLDAQGWKRIAEPKKET
jgi:hypothetical protein